jgi:hypothetical protein
MQEKCLTEIKKARQLHIDWVRRAEMLIQGLPVTQESLPIDSQKCHFGIWFNSGAKQLLAIDHFKKIIESIDKEHIDLHDEYKFIHNIYFKEHTDPSLLKKFFGKKEITISSEEKTTALKHLTRLQEISKSLTKNLDKFFAQVRLLKPEDIQKIEANTTL